MDSKPHDYEVKKHVVEEHKGFMDTIADKAKAAGTAVKEAFTAAADNVKHAVMPGGHEDETKGSAYDASHWTADQANVAGSNVKAGEIRDIGGDIHKGTTDAKYQGLGEDINRGLDVGKETKYQGIGGDISRGVDIGKDTKYEGLGGDLNRGLGVGKETKYQPLSAGGDIGRGGLDVTSDTQLRGKDYGTGMGKQDLGLGGGYNQDLKLGSEQRGLGIGGDVNQGGLGVGGDRHQRAVDFGKDSYQQQGISVGGGVDQGGLGLGKEQRGLDFGSEQKQQGLDFGKDTTQQGLAVGSGYNQGLNLGSEQRGLGVGGDVNQGGLGVGGERLVGNQQAFGKEKRASDYQPTTQTYNQPTR
jgi:hypothetical protein